MADALIGIGIDLSEVVKAAGQLASTVEGDTEKALREIQRQAIKSAKGIEKAVKAQAREQRKAARDAERAARRAAAEAEKQAQEAREAAKGLAELAGISADKFDKARAVMAGLSTPMGQAAVAATGAALAVAGLAAAFVGAGVAAVSLTRTADDLLDELEPMQEALNIPASAVASIEAANVALDGAAAAGKALVVQLADKLAPAVERTAVLVVKLGLAAGDALSSMGGSAEVVGLAFTSMARAVVGALASPLQSLYDLVDITETIARATGFDDLADRIGGVQRSIGGLGLDAIELAFESVESATRDYDDAARDLLSIVEQTRKAEDKRTTATKAGTAADKAAAEAAKAAADAYRTYERALQAAQAPFVDRSELATLRRLQAALVESASAATLTVEQSAELSAALGQIADRIVEIQQAPTEMETFLAELDAAAAEGAAAFDGLAQHVNDAMSDIPWKGIYARGLVQATVDGVKKAGSVLSTFTGGALDGLLNPAALLGQIGEAAGPKQAKKLAKSMADQAVSFIEALATNIGPFATAIIKKIPDIVVAIAKAAPRIVVEIVKAAPQIAIALVKAIIQAIPVLIRSIVREVKRAVREAVQVGRRVRRRFSDTPGPQRVAQETQVAVAPGDYFVAARTMQGLRAQTGGSASSSSTDVSATMVIDFRDGPARLGVERATSRAVDRRGYGRNTTGRQRVY